MATSHNIEHIYLNGKEVFAEVANRDSDGNIIKSTYQKTINANNKLSSAYLNGNIPSSWLGTDGTHAARGNHTHTMTLGTSTAASITLSYGGKYSLTAGGESVTFAMPSKEAGSFSDLTSHPTTLSGYGITDAAAKNHTHTNMATYSSSSVGKVLTPSQDALMLPNMGNYAITNIKCGSVSIKVNYTIDSENSSSVDLPSSGSGSWYVALAVDGNGSKTIVASAQLSTNKVTIWLRRVRPFGSSAVTFTVRYIAFKYW